jgi:hypothetical protein
MVTVCIAWPGYGCVYFSTHTRGALPRPGPALMPVYRVFRNIAVPPARAHLLLKDCYLYVVELSILAQTPLVTFRRFLVLPLCRAPPFMDHSHADHLGLYNAVDVLPHPRLPG